jgi:phage shock protein C
MAATLVRPRRGKIVAGVCAALADRFEVPRAFVRLGFIFFGLFGVGEFVYVVLWIVIPKGD